MISKTNKAVFAGALMALVMLAAGLVVVSIADESDAVPDPERVGVDGYPITVFKEDGTSTGYQNLGDITLADGDEIWIYESVSDQRSIIVTDNKVVTICLHHSTVEFVANNGIKIRGGSVTVEGNGVLTEKVGQFNFGPIVLKGSANLENYSVVSIGPGIELRGWAGIFVDQNSGNNSGMVVTMEGKITSGTDTSGDTGYGVYVNGSIIKTTAGTDNVINPHVPVITLRNCTITSEGTGIFAAGYAVWDISDSSISGDKSGVEVRAGEFNAVNTTFVGKSTTASTIPNGNGTTTIGSGFAVMQHVSKQAINVVLDSCKSKGIYAFNEQNPQNNTSADIAKISVELNGGEYTTINNGTQSVSSLDLTGFINSGKFSISPATAYVANGKEILQIGDWYCVGTPIIADSNGTVTTEDESVVTTVETPSAVVKVKDVSFSIIGDSTLGAISVAAQKMTENFVQAPTAVASYDITIVTETSYSADITVDAAIPSGHNALVYYINDNGELVPVKVVSFTSSTVTFRTTHNTPFVVVTEPVPETPSIPDDEDDFPFSSGNGTASSSNNGSSDSTKLVAAAAAIVVIMLAAVAMMMAKKN